MTPTADPQHRPLALAITPAPTGYRLAFVGGATFEVVAVFATLDEAKAAYDAARNSWFGR